jgi:predicted adenine nucleotide alpha hydrolase (AANH) superfamily ATPase
LQKLREQDIDVKGYFYNPNIHPYREFKKRLATLRDFAREKDFEIELETEYGLTEYLQQVVFHENERCIICYRMRLKKTAQQALKWGAEAFSTTLLYSRFQNHNTIKRVGLEMAEEYGVPFHYYDFREGWQEGIDRAVAMDLYRQPYCGCIYSEQERYDKKLQKKLRKQKKVNV